MVELGAGVGAIVVKIDAAALLAGALERLELEREPAIKVLPAKSARAVTPAANAGLTPSELAMYWAAAFAAAADTARSAPAAIFSLVRAVDTSASTANADREPATSFGSAVPIDASDTVAAMICCACAPIAPPAACAASSLSAITRMPSTLPASYTRAPMLAIDGTSAGAGDLG